MRRRRARASCERRTASVYLGILHSPLVLLPVATITFSDSSCSLAMFIATRRATYSHRSMCFFAISSTVQCAWLVMQSRLGCRTSFVSTEVAGSDEGTTDRRECNAGYERAQRKRGGRRPSGHPQIGVATKLTSPVNPQMRPAVGLRLQPQSLAPLATGEL